MNFRKISLLFLICIALVLAACGGAGEEPTEAPAVDVEETGGEETGAEEPVEEVADGDHGAHANQGSEGGGPYRSRRACGSCPGHRPFT